MIIIATDDKELNYKLRIRLIKKGYLVNDAIKFRNIDFPAILNIDNIFISIYSGSVNLEKSKNIKI